MNLSLGIVGLPNVGKSTLFNALTKQQVLAANYPFATIDPNFGIVPVHDERIQKIADVEKPEKVVPAVVEFVDIAGIVKGAADGQGLGNKFLANIREVEAIVQVVRAFEDPNITHVENSVDPKRDIELINTELILKDLESLQARIKTVSTKGKLDPKMQPLIKHLNELQEHLSSGKLAKDFEIPNDEIIKTERRQSFLLTDKPMIFVVNTKDKNGSDAVEKIKDVIGSSNVIAMDIKQEADLAELDDNDRAEFMQELGVTKTGLDTLTAEAYSLLGLISYFTSGPKEVRAWTIKKGSTAPEAAGVIHTDIQQNFIAADVITWNDFVEFGGWLGGKEKGKVRLEGKTYVVNDGDVMLFKHNG